MGRAKEVPGPAIQETPDGDDVAATEASLKVVFALMLKRQGIGSNFYVRWA